MIHPDLPKWSRKSTGLARNCEAPPSLRADPRYARSLTANGVLPGLQHTVGIDWLGGAQTPSHGNRWAEVLAMFYPHHYHRGMPDTSHLRPATAAEIADALSFALRYHGRKR